MRIASYWDVRWSIFVSVQPSSGLSPPRLSGSALTAIFQGCVPILRLNNSWEMDVVITVVVTTVLLPLQAWVTSLRVGSSSGAQSPPSWVQPWEPLSDLSRLAFMVTLAAPWHIYWEQTIPTLGSAEITQMAESGQVGPGQGSSSPPFLPLSYPWAFSQQESFYLQQCSRGQELLKPRPKSWHSIAFCWWLMSVQPHTLPRFKRRGHSLHFQMEGVPPNLRQPWIRHTTFWDPSTYRELHSTWFRCPLTLRSYH